MNRVSMIVLAALLVAAVAAPGSAVGPKGAAQGKPAVATPPAAPTKPAPASTILSADSVAIAYTDQGAGEPAIVFIHCWSCDRSYWANQVDAFAKKHRVVTLDLAGHGESGMGRGEWTVASFAADVVSVVKALDLERVILVGHSMGGPVALEAARLVPERVIGIVGVDTYQDFEETYTDQQKAQFLMAFQSNFAAVTDRFVRSMFPPAADSTLVERIAADMSSGPSEVGIGAMKSLLDYDPKPAVTGIAVPIRSINADLWPTNVEGNARVAKSFKAVFMPGRGHFLHIEDPATFNKLLAQTIAEIVKTK